MDNMASFFYKLSKLIVSFDEHQYIFHCLFEGDEIILNLSFFRI